MKHFCRLAITIVVAGCASSPAKTTPAAAVLQESPSRTSPSAPRADSSRDVLMRVSSSDVFSPQRGDAALKTFVADVPATLNGGECNLMRTGGSGALIVAAYFPARNALQTQMTLTFDSAGHLVRFNERRGVPKMPPMSSMTPIQRDSTLRVNEAAIRSTNISMDYAVDQAIVMNRGAGRPTNAIMGTVRAIEGLERLGPPKDHVERARRLCGV